MIIGISGKKNSGKDCVGSFIKDLDDTYNIVKYADKLKEMTAILIGCTREDLEDRDFKETPLDEEWWIYNITNEDGSSFILPYKESDVSQYKCVELIKVTPRWLLQRIGTDCFRNIIHPNTWVNATLSNYNKNCNLIITDVRFKNEANRIKELGGVIIRISRKETDDYSCKHRSEIDLDDYDKFDYKIYNDGTIDELKDIVRRIFEDINKRNENV